MSLTSVILVDLVSLERMNDGFGALLFFEGASCLLGAPLAGWVYDVTGDYTASFYLMGAEITLGAIVLIIIPVMQKLHR